MKSTLRSPTQALGRFARLMVVTVTALAIVGCSSDTPETLVVKAREAIAKGDLASAEIHLKNALSQRADNFDALLALAGLYARSFDWASCEKEAKRALAADPTSAKAAALLFEAMNYTSAPAAQLAAIEAVRPATPQMKSVVEAGRGAVLLKQGKGTEARQAYDLALASDSSNIVARVGVLGLRAVAEGPSAVAGEVDALVAANPASTEVLWLQSRVREATGNTAGARESLEKLLEAWPGHLFARLTLARMVAQQGDLDAASKQLDMILARARGWYEPLALKAEFLLRKGKLDEARDAYLLAAKSAPDVPVVLRAGAAVSLARGELEQAETLASKFFVLTQKRDPDAARLLASARLAKGDPTGALEVLQPMIELPNPPALLLAMAGEARMRMRQFDKALALLERAAAVAPDEPYLQLTLGTARASVRDFKGATDAWRRSAELDKAGIRADRMLVELLQQQGDKAAVESAIERLATKPGGAGVAHILRSRASLMAGDAKGARASLERAIAADPALFEAARVLAGLDAAAGDMSAAKGRYETFLKVNPDSDDAQLALVDLAIRGGTPGEASEQIKKALAARPDSERLLLAAYRLDLAERKPGDAIARLQSAIQRRPGALALIEALANAQIANGEREQAKATLDKLAGLAPEDIGTQLRIARLRGGIGDDAGALSVYRSIQRRTPDAVQARVGEAATLVKLGKTSEAQGVIREIQKGVTNPADALVVEGEVLAAGGDWSSALPAFRRAEKLAPERARIVMHLHQALIRNGAQTEAKALLERKIAASNVATELLMYAGDEAMAAKDFQSAAQHYGRVYKANPKDSLALNNYAWAKIQLKDPAGLELAQQAFAMAPTRPEVADTLATALLQSGQADRALPLLRSAAAQLPRSPDVRLRAIEAQIKTGDKAEARRSIDWLLRDFPDSPEAARARELGKQL